MTPEILHRAAVVAGLARPRTVSPLPPHHPEPLPDEPFAPVYDYRPLGRSPLTDRTGWLLDPPDPDPAVFGLPGSGNLQQPRRDAYDGEPFRGCACGVTWRGKPACWACGTAVPG